MSRKHSLTLFFSACGLLFPLSVFALVDINTASLTELDQLKGIGPVKAQAIVDYRQTNGLFYSIEGLMKVKGIGPITYAGLKDDITVGDVTPPPAPPPAPAAAPRTGTTAAKITTTKQPAAPSALAGAAARAEAPLDPYYPLVPWLMGVAAAFGLGIAGALYIRPGAVARQETKRAADEFEIS
jgi:competence protein ComEA